MRSSKRSVKVFLDDIVTHCATIETYYAEGLRDKKTLQAIERNIEIIGEAVKHIPEEIRAISPHVPWQDIADMRNLVIHEYFGIAEERIWAVAEKDVPELKENVLSLLSLLIHEGFFKE